eukprot:TRINITY_DN3682_c0_g1_i1.p1 TRINITY_DN3682_c0_g1~~TRINITY_DN3682_c0_g1_i1.p1  ORF type:complete len:221 (-),score=70.34 TRINITY_DN3682_c0_g1_i1:76-738(-)
MQHWTGLVAKEQNRDQGWNLKLTNEDGSGIRWANQKIQESGAQLTADNVTLARIRGERAAAQNQARRLEADLVSLRTDLENSDAANANKQADIDRLRQERNTLKDEKKKLLLKEIKNKQEVEKAQQDLEDANEKIRAMELALGSKQEIIDDYDNQLANVQNAFSKLFMSINKVRESSGKIERTVSVDRTGIQGQTLDFKKEGEEEDKDGVKDDVKTDLSV